MRRSKCKGVVVARMHCQAVRSGSYVNWLQHRVRFNGGLCWCEVCGAHTTSRLRNLGCRCQGPLPPQSTARSRLALLQDGAHPVTKRRLQRGGRLTVAKWQQTLEQALG